MKMSKLIITSICLLLSASMVQAQTAKQDYKIVELGEFIGKDANTTNIEGFKIVKSTNLSEKEIKNIKKQIGNKKNYEADIKKCKLMPKYAILYKDTVAYTIELEDCPKIMIVDGSKKSFKDLKINSNLKTTILKIVK